VKRPRGPPPRRVTGASAVGYHRRAMHPDEMPRLSVAELRARFVTEERPLPDGCEQALERDPRSGARAVLAAVRRRRRANRAEGQRLRNLLRHETRLWARGVTLVAGVDEAGMAPLAGPVVAAAVILPRSFRARGIDDSKQVDAAERERLAVEIKAAAVCWAVGIATVDEVDTINIYHAGLLAMRRAIPQQPIIHGDALSLTIAAASIVAKTTRDAMMCAYDAEYPGYGFARHKGYPTAEHFDAIARLGVCPLHRRSFAPIREALGLDPVQGDLFAAPEAALAVEEDAG